MEFCFKNFIKNALSLGFKATIGVLLSWNTVFAGPDDDRPEPVPSIPEIRESIVRHKKSVVRFGIHTLTFFPEYFPVLAGLAPHLRWPLVNAFLQLHDNPKLWSLPDTLDSTHPSEKMPLENMQANWHKDIPDHERGWIDELNSRESVYKSQELMKIISRLGVKQTRELLNDLFNLEDVSDVLDTKLNRWKEMGHKKDPGPTASEKYFRHVRKSELLAEIARKVEITMLTNGVSCMRLF